MRFVEGRRLFASLARGYPYRKPKSPEVVQKDPYGRPLPRLVAGDPFGRPRPRPLVMDLIESMQLLHPNEKLKFGYIFSELLGLPKPRKKKTKETVEKFAVKLVKFDPDKRSQVLREVAWVKCTEKVIRHLSELGLSPSIECLKNVPYSLVKQDVTKEEANEIITKIEAAGGVAVMEPFNS